MQGPNDPDNFLSWLELIYKFVNDVSYIKLLMMQAGQMIQVVVRANYEKY
jgi:hypothetical protein